MSADPRKHDNGERAATDAAESQRRKWPEVSRLADVLSRILEENHLSPKIAQLYRGE